MPLNSAKLDAIRAKLQSQGTPSAPESIQPLPTNLQAGKAVVTAGLVSLEAAKTASASKTQITSQPVETARTINFQRVADSIQELQVAIHSAHPRMPQLLHDVWSTLHSYPEQVTLLSEEQCEVIFSGLEKIVDTDLAALTLKGALKPGGKKAPVTTASLGF